jgi:hypothetical protein
MATRRRIPSCRRLNSKAMERGIRDPAERLEGLFAEPQTQTPGADEISVP